MANTFLMFRSTSTGAAVMMDDCNSVTSDSVPSQFETASLLLNSGGSSPSPNPRTSTTADTMMHHHNNNNNNNYQNNHRYRQMQSSLSDNTTTAWQQGRADSPHRHRMIAQIVKILKQRTKPDCPKQWLDKLPKMAKRLESCLYRSALSFEEYNDDNTLEERLKEMATLVARPNLDTASPTTSLSIISRQSSEISSSSSLDTSSLADSRHVEGASALTALRAGIYSGRRKSWVDGTQTQVRFH